MNGYLAAAGARSQGRTRDIGRVFKQRPAQSGLGNQWKCMGHGKETSGDRMGRMGMEEKRKIPGHVAIILDGNGRWAKKKGMQRNYRQVQPAKTEETICEEDYRIGVQ